MSVATQASYFAERRRPARHEGVDPPAVRHRQRHGGAGLFGARRARAGCRSGLPLRPPTTLAILAGFAHNRRVMVTGYHGTGKSTHIEQVAARLNWPCVRVNLDSHISRIDLIGKDAIVHPRRPAGDRIPRRHPALGAAAQRRALLRRIRRRPARRDVRDPARARSLRQADAARPEQGDQAASGVPPVRHRQHGRPRRHLGPLSRHPADQPGPDGPLVDRHHAQLPAARQRGRDRARQGEALPHRRRAATSSTRWCGSPI